MKIWKRSVALVCVAIVFAVVFCAGGMANADGQRKYRLPKGVYVDLTGDFYEALQGTTEGGQKVYTNSMSDEYLRQIAVSSTFTVRTNLQIIKQQERIIQLLQSIRDKEK